MKPKMSKKNNTKRNSKKRNSKKKSNKNKNKNNKNKNKNKNKIGGTGVLLNQDPQSAFEYFINNSTFKIKSYGSNGITILATLKPTIISPYKSIDSNTYGDPIIQIIIKLILINAIPVSLTIIEKTDTTAAKFITSTILNNVVDELNIQTDIALKTMTYLEPLCPSPLYFNENISVELLTIILHNIIDNKPANIIILNKILTDMIQCIEENIVKSISVFVMEYAENYVELTYVISPDYIYMAMYIIIKLAIDTGYTHGDYHPNNIMINRTKPNYFNGIIGAPLLIDYGFAVKIQPNIMDVIKNHYVNKKYTNILLILSEIPRKDGLDLRSYPENYGYLFGVRWNDKTKEGRFEGFQVDANAKLARLFRLRDDAIKKTITIFEGLHSGDPIIPLLPLPKKFRANMYSGLEIYVEVVIPTLEFFTEVEKRKISIVIAWIYDIMHTKFDKKYKDKQILCFFIIFCYNFVYILNNVEFDIKTIQLYALIALLFIENFDTSNNNQGKSAIKFITSFINKRFSDIDIKLKIDTIYLLFKNKKPNCEYASIFASYDFASKDELINFMLDPLVYSNPASLLQTSRFIGPIQRIDDDEAYVFPDV